MHALITAAYTLPFQIRSAAFCLQVSVQLRGQQQQEEFLVHPDASIYMQLQLGLQDAGLVLSAHFGSEAIQRGDRFMDWGMESGAKVSVVVVSLDGLMGDDYMALDVELQAELEGLLR